MIVAGVLDCIGPPPNEMRLVVVDRGGAYRGMTPVVRPVSSEPDDDRALPVAARKTWAVTGVDGSGRVAVPSPTFVHVIQSASTVVWSTGEVKPTVRTLALAVTAGDDTAAPPADKTAPLRSVRTAVHPKISNPNGMWLNATLTCTPEPGNTAPVLNCAADLKSIESHADFGDLWRSGGCRDCCRSTGLYWASSK